jgi:hypothetical protein
MLYRTSSALCLALALMPACAGAPAPEVESAPSGTDAAPPPRSDAATDRAPVVVPDAAEEDSPSPTDSAAPMDAAVTAADASPAPADAAAGPFSCTLVLGIKETGEWFNAGFETIVENARWEVVPVHNGHIELWADPRSDLWAMKPASPCTQAAAPDRVVFVGTNYDYTTTAEFVPRYLAVIENVKSKYPAVRRIDLMTYVRAPGNMPCPGNLSLKTWIKPAQDEAIAQVAAMFPAFVQATPKFEVRSCSDFSMPPHFTAAAAMAAAKLIGAYYLAN